MINIRVMLIEDESTVLKELVSFLEYQVSEIQSYQNAKDALEDFDTYKPELVITDIRMPGMDGLEMSRKMRERNPKIPIVVMSAFSEPKYFIDAISLKIDYFLLKPISLDDLLEKIDIIARGISIKKELILKERALENEKKKLKDILNNISSIVTLVSIENKMIFANDKFYELFAFKSFEDFKSQHKCICELFLPKEDFLQTMVDGIYWIEYMLKNPEGIFYASMKDKEGIERDFLVSSNVLHDSGKEFFVVTFTDLTLLKKAQQEAKVASEAKLDFLRNMSHEIRTPLNGIVGIVPLLEKRIDPSSRENRYVEIIKSSANSLEFMLENILNFSKIDMQREELDFIQVDLNVEISNLYTAMSQSQSSKNIFLELDFDTSLCVFADYERIRQVLVNLLHNAIKFTDENGNIILYAKLLSQNEKMREIQFGVVDDGIGIKKEHLSEIFELFRQADNSLVREYDGSGLGLSLSKKLVESMDSQLQVKSEEGKGSEFFFVLNLKSC